MLNKEIKSAKGIVLFSNKVKEDSAIVKIFTDYSNQDFYLKNVYKLKSNLKAGLLVGNFIELDYYTTDSINIVKSLRIIFDVSKYYLDYKKNLTIAYFIESLYRYENDTYIKNNTVDKYGNFLINLDKANLFSFIIVFLGELISDLGLKPNTESCVICHNKKNLVNFSFKDGGFICLNCFQEKNFFFSKMDLYVIKFAFSNHNLDDLFRNIPKDSAIKIINLFNDFLENNFNFPKSKIINILINELNINFM